MAEVKKRKKNQSNEVLCRERLGANKTKILTGSLLCIDPSSGSESSQPGWALFQNGVLVEAGVAEINHRLELRSRLRLVWEYFSVWADKVDIVLIEEIPVRPIRTKMDANSSGKTWMNAKSHGSLVEAIGATKAAFPVSIPVVKLPASLWHRVSRDQGWAMEANTVKKNDYMDAVRIGMTAIFLLGGKVNE